MVTIEFGDSRENSLEIVISEFEASIMSLYLFLNFGANFSRCRGSSVGDQFLVTGHKERADRRSTVSTRGGYYEPEKSISVLAEMPLV